MDVSNRRAGREWTNKHTRQHVAQDDGLPQLPSQHSTGDGSEEDVRKVPKECRVRLHKTSFATVLFHLWHPSDVEGFKP